MNSTKKIVLAGLCVALGIVLPMAFHAIPNAGSIFLPMHIPVLLCGLICGPVYGLACGAITPAVSSVATGMPPAAILPGMVCELAVYGLVSGLLTERVRTGNRVVDIYISLIVAMVCGRLVSGLLNSLIFRAGAYSMQLWVTASFVTSLPGIVIQLIAVPAIVGALMRARLISIEQRL